jgi:hypothetical protein
VTRAEFRSFIETTVDRDLASWDRCYEQATQ